MTSDPTEPRHRRVLVVAPRAYDRAKHGPHLPMNTPLDAPTVSR